MKTCFPDECFLNFGNNVTSKNINFPVDYDSLTRFHYNLYLARMNFLLTTRYSLRFTHYSLIFILSLFNFARQFDIFYLFLATFTCYSLLLTRRSLFSSLLLRYFLSVNFYSLHMFLITFYDKAAFKK